MVLYEDEQTTASSPSTLRLLAPTKGGQQSCRVYSIVPLTTPPDGCCPLLFLPPRLRAMPIVTLTLTLLSTLLGQSPTLQTQTITINNTTTITRIARYFVRNFPPIVVCRRSWRLLREVPWV